MACNDRSADITASRVPLVHSTLTGRGGERNTSGGGGRSKNSWRQTGGWTFWLWTHYCDAAGGNRDERRAAVRDGGMQTDGDI